MPYIDLNIDPAPSGVGYDDEFPTQNNELLAAQIHNTLQDMEDEYWRIGAGPTDYYQAIMRSGIRDQIKVVFDYAKTAIHNFRTIGVPGISEPTAALFSTISYSDTYPETTGPCIQLYIECMKMMYRIYYLWQTEEDPLRIKDYIRDMLIAWPLMDTTIALKDEGGSELRIYPSWSEFG